MRLLNRTVILQCGIAMLLALACTAKLQAEMSVVFTTTPITDAITGFAYVYDAYAVSSDGAAVRYSLQYGPAGMTVGETTGRVTWSPATDGDYSVGIRAELANNPTQSALQEWQIHSVSGAASSILTTPLPFSSVCVGENISVNYTATGNFVPGNAFILQISDASGGFGNFLNIGSITSTTSGTITAKLPGSIPPGSRYRVRVMSSNPVVVGSDNGSDFSIVARPVASFTIIDSAMDSTAGHRIGIIALENSPVRFANTSQGGVSYHWEFGDGAVPPTSDQSDPGPVTYTTEGMKTVTLTVVSGSGCSTTTVKEDALHVVSIHPSIPSYAHPIPQGPPEPADAYWALWVCPGGTYNGWSHEDLRWIYAESGASVEVTSASSYRTGAVIYLKSGASLNFTNSYPEDVIIVQEPGASVKGGDNGALWNRVYTIRVPSLSFDYTDAPVGGCPSLAPYQKRIPDDVLMVHGAQTSSESQKEFWIRNGGVLEAAGDGNTYIADAGARVVATGSNATVYLKNGSSFEARGGSGHRIFYEPDAVIVNAGAESGLFPSSELTYLYQGKVTGVRNEEALMESRDLEVLPNPAGEVVTVRHERAGIIIRRIELHDAVGRLVREEGVILHRGESGSISLAGLVPGVYYVRASGEGAVLVKKIVVR